MQEHLSALQLIQLKVLRDVLPSHSAARYTVILDRTRRERDACNMRPQRPGNNRLKEILIL